MEYALTQARANRLEQGIVIWLSNLADLEIEIGQLDRALARLSESLIIARSIGETRFVIQSLESVAAVAAARQADQAARLYGATAALREATGFHVIASSHEVYE